MFCGRGATISINSLIFNINSLVTIVKGTANAERQRSTILIKDIKLCHCEVWMRIDSL